MENIVLPTSIQEGHPWRSYVYLPSGVSCWPE